MVRMGATMKRIFAIALAASPLLSLTACGVIRDSVNDLLGREGDDTDDFATEGWDDAELRADLPTMRPDLGEPEAEPTAVVPLERATVLIPFPARGGTDMGFRVDKLTDLYALAGAVEAPSWSAPSEGEPRRVRDNDIDTAWTCVPEGESRCALGIHFPEQANIKAVRLFAAATNFSEFPRIKRLRIHTEAGFTDALLPDDNTHVYAQLGEPIRTRTLALEILEVHPGRGNTPRIHISELEVYGDEGTAREPLQIDPAATFVVLPERPWLRRGRENYERNEMFVHYLDERDEPHRFISGTAIRGRMGDRVFLIERMQAQSECTAPRGTFFLLDTKTRMVAPLGDLGGVGGDAFRAANGLGIAIGFKGQLDTKLSGLFATEAKYQRRRTPIRADLRTENYFETWGLDSEMVQRAAADLDHAPAGCTSGTEDTLAILEAARATKAAAAGARKKGRRKGKKKKAADPLVPGQWQVCDLADGARAFVSDRGTCGPGWDVAVVDAEGTLVEQRSESRASSHVRLVMRPNATLLVEVGGADDRHQLLRATPEGLFDLAPRGSTVLHPPAACRETCLDGFPNPNAPVWK